MKQKIKRGGVKKGTLFLLFSVVLLGGGVVAIALLGDRTENNVPIPGTKEAVEALQEETLSIALEVEDVKYQVNVAPGSNVYDAMAKIRETSDLSFEATHFSELGFFVQEINGLRQNPKTGQYWIYYINGQKANIGISMYELYAHDVISWKYENEE